ncbi:gluconate 2-dehydrogenase subunit 3 family protein [Myxococcota bacterium]|nr:gluconate 2-dehydrogenase subunit 3 family protein [Myxococcota bacterium]
MAIEEAPSELSNEEMQFLAQVLDAIIPPDEDGGSPGAGEVGLGDILQQKSPALVPVLKQGLTALSREMESRQLVDFGALSPNEKCSLLERIGGQHPDFFPGLLFPVYANYYQQPRVLKTLGLEARTPYPLGYDLESGDLDLLDPVRNRPPFYRRC